MSKISYRSKDWQYLLEAEAAFSNRIWVSMRAGPRRSGKYPVVVAPHLTLRRAEQFAKNILAEVRKKRKEKRS